MTFVDVLSSALLNATQELYPSAAHWDRRAPLLAAHMANQPAIAALIAATMTGEQASPDTVGTGIGALTETSSEEAPGMYHGTQPALPFAESRA